MSTEEHRLTTAPVESIQFVKELYPRLREDDAAIERYRAAIDNLPPIDVARGHVLVDGFHRWQAHRKEQRPTIDVIDHGDLTDAEIFRLAITKNAQHGQQLSAKDKARLAGDYWLKLGHLDPRDRINEITSLLSVSAASVERWTKDARRAEKEQQQAKAWDMWLDCHDQEAIAAALDKDQSTVSRWLDAKAADDDFASPPVSLQHFDIWQFGKATGESSYFGKMPPQVVENLLWLYTEPGDIVVDPFAGGGTTIDVAKRMGRRVWASDRKPSTPTLPIHEHDITTGWPDDAPKKAAFVLLDPPYWKQAAGQYSTDQGDLGNMDYDAFLSSWRSVLEHVKGRAERVAFIISPTQDGDAVIDHAFDMYRVAVELGYESERRIVVPYQTQQATGQQVQWAKDKRRLLKLYRDLVVLR